MTHRVLQTEDLSPAASAWLRERCELERCGPGDEGFGELLARADALLVRTYTRVDAALLARATRLRCVARAGVGLDNIDLRACEDRGVAVVHTPDANSDAVAEYVFALVHDATRPRVFLDRALDPARWNATRRELTAPRQLNEITLGVLGLGRIGSRVARIARGYAMRVLYHDLREIPEDQRHGAASVDRDTLLRSCDVLTIHVDPRPSNHRLVGRDALALLQPHAILVNTSRGVIVDELALAGFLRDHPRAQALLDVHDPEPVRATSPLLALKNAHLSPHLAACTATASENMSWVVRDLWRVLCGEEAEHRARP